MHAVRDHLCPHFPFQIVLIVYKFNSLINKSHSIPSASAIYYARVLGLLGTLLVLLTNVFTARFLSSYYF